MNKNQTPAVGLAMLAVVYCLMGIILKIWTPFPDTNLSFAQYPLHFKQFKPAYFIGVFCFSVAVVALAILSLYWILNRGKTDYGSASFGTKKLAQKLGLLGRDGFFLGMLGRKFHESNALNIPALSALIVGPPGNGKTAGIIIPAILNLGKNASALILDVKKEIYLSTSGQRAKDGRVILFSPNEETGGAGFNPFARNAIETLTKGEKIKLVGVISQVLYPAPPPSSDPTWVNNGRALFSLAAQYLIFRDGGTSICRILDFVLSPQFKIALGNYHVVKASNPDFPASLEGEIFNFLNMPADQFGSVLSTFTEKLSSFRNDIVRGNTETMDLPIDLRNETVTIYINVKPTDIESVAGVISMLFSYYNILLYREEKKPEHRQVFMILDEFPRLNKMDDVLQAPATARSYGISLIFVVQSLSQIVAKYSEADMKGFLDILSYFLIIGIGGDSDTAKRFSELIGNKTIQKESISRQNGIGQGSISTNDEGLALVSAQFFQNNEKFTAIFLHQGYFKRPFKVHLRPYFKDAQLLRMIGSNDKKIGP